jgi:hypothetical protein
METATKNVTAAGRMERYGAYLAGIQSANQQYGLGLGRLRLDEKKIDQDYSLDRFRAELEKSQTEGQLGRWQTQNEADLITAYANKKSADTGMLRTIMGT